MIVVVMILRKFFGSRVKSGAICVLWALVAIRLLIPVQLFGNVVNVTDYLTENVMNLQGRDITTEVQEKSGSVSDSQIGDDLQAVRVLRSNQENMPPVSQALRFQEMAPAQPPRSDIYLFRFERAFLLLHHKYRD